MVPKTVSTTAPMLIQRYHDLLRSLLSDSVSPWLRDPEPRVLNMSRGDTNAVRRYHGLWASSSCRLIALESRLEISLS